MRKNARKKLRKKSNSSSPFYFLVGVKVVNVEIAEATRDPYKGDKLVGISGVRMRDRSIFLTMEEAKHLAWKLLTIVTWERDRGFMYDKLKLDRILVPKQGREMIEIYGFSPESDAQWCRLEEAYVLAMDLLQLLMFGVGIYVSEDYSDY